MSTFTPIRLDAYNPGPMTGEGNHTYLLVEEHGPAVLIDAGVGDARHLDELADALDRRHAHLRDVLVTHGHPDHASGAPVLLTRYPAARFFKCRWPEVDERSTVRWQPIQDGDRFVTGEFALTALHTPGHSPDHVAFWHEPSRTIFTGDLVVQGSSVMIHGTRGGDLTDYLRSLQRLLTLNPGRLLPAHGPEVTDPAELLRGYIGHRHTREAQVIAAIVAGHHTVPSIVESIYHGLASALLPAATENVYAHLEKLRREGRAIERNGQWMMTAES